MNLYSEFVKNNEKVKVKFESDPYSDRLFSNWEINSLTSKINSFYYKTEMLNSIESLILSGISPSKIWIINNSVDIYNQYSRYPNGFIHTPNEITKLYYLGVPISLEPSNSVLRLNIFFSAFREINYILVKNNLRYLDRHSILTDIYIKIIENQTSLNVFDYFETTIKVDNPPIEEDIWKSIEKILSNYKNELLKERNQSSFFKIFQSLERPLIVVQYEDHIELLGYELFKRSEFKKENPRFLETNTISQNSPLIIELSMTVAFLSGLISVGYQRVQMYRTDIEHLEQQNDKEQEIQDLESEIQKIEAEIADLEQNSVSFNQSSNSNKLTSPVLDDLSETRAAESKKLAKEFDEKKMSISM